MTPRTGQDVRYQPVHFQSRSFLPFAALRLCERSILKQEILSQRRKDAKEERLPVGTTSWVAAGLSPESGS